MMWSSEGSFARKQLEKHGWTDGAGLGAKEDGIAQAIKVKLKMDTAGVGHDPAKEFTHHWWDDAFNKAASNITVEANEDGVIVKSSKKTNKHKVTAQKKAHYGNFVKSSLLSNGIEQEVARDVTHVDEEKDLSCKKPQTLLLPEDELFKICGGRTAHKAARHGLKLNGKLQRIEEQERLLFQKYKSQNSPSAHQHKSTTEESRRIENTKHSLSSDHKIRQRDDTDLNIFCEKEPSSKDVRQKQKKKKKKRKQDFSEDEKHSSRPCQKCESICSCNGEKDNGFQISEDPYNQAKRKSSRVKDRSLDDPIPNSFAVEEEISFMSDVKEIGFLVNTKHLDSAVLLENTKAAGGKKRKRSKNDRYLEADNSLQGKIVDNSFVRKKKSRRE